MPRAKKRILSTSESEGEGNKEKASTSPVKAKKKKMSDEKKVKSATASSSSDEQSKAAKKAKKEKKPETPVAAKKPETPTQSDKKDKSIKAPTHKDITVKDLLRLKRDNLRKMEQSKSSGGGTTTTTDNDDDGSESVSSLAVSESSREGNAETAPINGTKELSLPTDFTKDLCDAILSLKTYADKNKKDGTNLFDNHMKEQLLKIDSLARAQGKGITGQVYRQLENFIPSTRKAILTKVNRFRIQHAENRIKNEIKKLKMALNTIMPDLVRKYDEDLKQYEAKKNISHIRESPTENKQPRRRFHWNENLRQLLYDIVQYVSDFHQLTKAKKEPLNEYTAKYLKDHVMPLWPEEWIKTEDFQKELEKKRRKEGRQSTGASPAQAQPSTSSTPNGKQSQKTENPTVNGKSPSQLNLTPSQLSVIKRSSDHSINSIINSASPSPPAITPSHSNPKTPQVVDIEKLLSSDLLKVQPPKVPKFNQPSSCLDIVSPEKHRISDGSDSDCAIIESPIKNATTIKPQQQYSSHHLNNNNKVNVQHGSGVKQAHHQKEKEKPPKEQDFSMLISSIESLSVS